VQSRGTSGSTILSTVLDRDAIARARRRRELEEALADEAEREHALREQLEAVVLDAEAPRIDAFLRATLDPADVDLIDDLLGGPDDDSEDDAWLEEWQVSLETAEADVETAGPEDELARLHTEIARSTARRDALVRAIALLEAPLPAPAAERGA
jgi:hypothetical protein